MATSIFQKKKRKSVTDQFKKVKKQKQLDSDTLSIESNESIRLALKSSAERIALEMNSLAIKVQWRAENEDPLLKSAAQQYRRRIQETCENLRFEMDHRQSTADILHVLELYTKRMAEETVKMQMSAKMNKKLFREQIQQDIEEITSETLADTIKRMQKFR